ncbi:Uma2 family endonuclease [Persephonella sp. KM09-Lau-8]|uniref:Uma2 family endonuclease n=1 Tax=Persephonella sp. KM09-Lau-8 TaxID=1158345 RepID=UPI00049507A9|nr:Uma2 family endonuclease [Persephonella sp. KM09-Lau-8]
MEAVISKKTKTRKRVPKYLIYEMRKGSPIYYRDYDKVISGEKTTEEIMGSSELQSIFVSIILKWLYKQINDKKYFIAPNEIGYKFAPRSWYNLDIAIIEKDKLKKISDKYLTIPPKVVIEIDTKADLRKFENPQDYFHRKTQDLLDSGVEKVIWIFTQDKKVWVAEKGKRWIITDWNDTIDVIDNLKLNIENLLKEEGVEF